MDAKFWMALLRQAIIGGYLIKDIAVSEDVDVVLVVADVSKSIARLVLNTVGVRDCEPLKKTHEISTINI